MTLFIHGLTGNRNHLMPVIDVSQISSVMKRGQTLAGLDLGTRTIGLAVSDIGLLLANPRPVLKRKKFAADAAALLAFFARENVGCAVIGLPLNMDGSSGARVQSTRAFVRNILQHQDFSFVFWDERLSTVAAERSLLEMDVSRGKRANRIDSAAAAFILQGALDQLRWHAHSTPIKERVISGSKTG